MTTERERATEATLLAAVLDQLPVGVVIAEAPSGRVTRTNRQARELVRRPLEADSVEEYGWFDLHRPDGSRLSGDETPLGRAVVHGETTTDERIEFVDGKGERRIVSVNAGPVRDADGTIVAAVAALEDVTERERAAEAERDFVTNAAHELRTPLAAIAGAIEVLQAGAKELPDQRDLFLAHIERESWRLGRLARALLLLARTQMGAEEAKLEIVPLRPLLRSIAQGIRPAPGVELRVRCGPAVAALSNADLLEQALVNLAGNAARFTSAGSISLAARVKGPDVVIEVRDTGEGLSTAAQALAFERFYRGDTSRSSGGHGLGLAIAKEAIEAVHGTIELESDRGRGTVARVRLPVAKLLT
jgi:PAS domain S-box-containing protein